MTFIVTSSSCIYFIVFYLYIIFRQKRLIAFNIFKSYEENPVPSSNTNRLIKTGIFAYTRNPIYLSFLLFFISMFLIFENVMYFISFLALSIWIHHWVIVAEENYLNEKFNEEYERYTKAVKRWLLF